MQKRVRVIPPNHMPIPTSMVPIRGNVEDIHLDCKDIFICISAKAQVYEKLINGSEILLNFTNYDKDNNAEIAARAKLRQEEDMRKHNAQEAAKKAVDDHRNNRQDNYKKNNNDRQNKQQQQVENTETKADVEVTTEPSNEEKK